MATTTRVFASRTRTGIERAALVPCAVGVPWEGDWKIVASSWAPAVRVQLAFEVTYDNGQTYEEFGRTTVTGEQPARGSTGGSVGFVPRANGSVRVSCDTSGSWRYAVDLADAIARSVQAR